MSQVFIRKISLLIGLAAVVSGAQALSCVNSNSGKDCIIFITDTHNGNFGGDSSDHDGKAEADDYCNSQASSYYPSLYQSGIRFKALLAFNHATKIGRDYYQAWPHNEEPISPANRLRIATATNGTLSDVLNSPIVGAWDSENKSIWIGMNLYTAETNYKNSCDNWNNKSHGNTTFHGYIGYTKNTNTDWLDADGVQVNCKDNRYLACVAQ
jgi:hypothetical protein